MHRWPKLGKWSRLVEGQGVLGIILLRHLPIHGTFINLSGKVQLSDRLTKQAGRDLVRYTQENGRVTLPVIVTGSASSPHVSIDMAGAAQRALLNKAAEAAGRAIERNLGGLFGK